MAGIVNSYRFIKSECISFLLATGINDQQIKTALCSHVASLKDAGLWEKLIFYTPFLGDSFDTMKYDLITATPILSSSGTINYSENGIALNGEADNRIVLLGGPPPISAGGGVDFIVRNNYTVTATGQSESNGFHRWGNYIRLYVKVSSPNDVGIVAYGRNEFSFPLTDIESKGIWSLQKDSETGLGELYRNGTLITSFNDTNGALAAVDNTVFLGVITAGNIATPATCIYNSWIVRQHLTEEELQAFHSILATFNTALGR